MPVIEVLQDKVTLSQTLDLVRPDLDLPLPSDQIQIRLPSASVTGLNFVGKGQRLREDLVGVAPLHSAFRPLSPTRGFFNGGTLPPSHHFLFSMPRSLTEEARLDHWFDQESDH